MQLSMPPHICTHHGPLSHESRTEKRCAQPCMVPLGAGVSQRSPGSGWLLGKVDPAALLVTSRFCLLQPSSWAISSELRASTTISDQPPTTTPITTQATKLLPTRSLTAKLCISAAHLFKLWITPFHPHSHQHPTSVATQHHVYSRGPCWSDQPPR